MRATVKLRALLFERGIEWSETDAEGGTYITGWRAGNGAPCAYSERVGKYPPHSFKRVTLYNVTPEQAIAVTVGEMCHDVSGRALRFECSKCGGLSPDIAPRFCPCCGKRVVYE